MPSFHTKVSLRGFHFEDAHLTVTLAAGITAADIGKAVTIDTTAPNKFKLAGADDKVFGRLEVVEDRKTDGQLVGTVAFRFSNTVPRSGAATVGQTAVGAGAGAVKGAAFDGTNFIAEILDANTVVVVKI